MLTFKSAPSRPEYASNTPTPMSVIAFTLPYLANTSYNSNILKHFSAHVSGTCKATLYPS